MKYRTFVTFNVLGGALWAIGVTLIGWGLGSRFPWLEEYLTPIALGIVVLSVAPMVYELLKHRGDVPAATEDLLDGLD
jgi:membrane-associated protein